VGSSRPSTVNATETSDGVAHCGEEDGLKS
jgi:hypothetical protein